MASASPRSRHPGGVNVTYLDGHTSFILDLELDDASAESGDDDLGRVLLADYLDVVERVDGVALVDLVVVFWVEEDVIHAKNV